MTRIVDTFPFSEPYEADLLWLKFSIEDDYITEWVIVENSYTFQGEYKGVFAEKIIFEDDRFLPFRNKVKIITADFKPEYVKSSSVQNDHIAFNAEFKQRNLSKEYICNKYNAEDLILLSDTDEILCLSNKKSLFSKYIDRAKKQGLARLPRKRFWYEFNNAWGELRTTPIVSVKFLIENNFDLGVIRKSNVINPIFDKEPLVFEFSYCFDREGIIRKYETFSHTGYSRDKIISALESNHIAVLNSDDLNKFSSHWLEYVPVNEHHLPKFVVDNFQRLKTGSISENYTANRETKHPSGAYLSLHQRILSKSSYIGLYRDIITMLVRIRQNFTWKIDN